MSQALVLHENHHEHLYTSYSAHTVVAKDVRFRHRTDKNHRM